MSAESADRLLLHLLRLIAAAPLQASQELTEAARRWCLPHLANGFPTQQESQRASLSGLFDSTELGTLVRDPGRLLAPHFATADVQPTLHSLGLRTSLDWPAVLQVARDIATSVHQDGGRSQLLATYIGRLTTDALTEEDRKQLIEDIEWVPPLVLLRCRCSMYM